MLILFEKLMRPKSEVTTVLVEIKNFILNNPTTINNIHSSGHSILHLLTDKGLYTHLSFHEYNSLSEIAHLILSYPDIINIRVKDAFGNLPLHYLAQYGNIELFKLMVTQYHANIFEKNYINETSLEVAIKYKQNAIITLIKQLINDSYSTEKPHVEFSTQTFENTSFVKNANSKVHATPMLYSHNWSKELLAHNLRDDKDRVDYTNDAESTFKLNQNASFR